MNLCGTPVIMMKKRHAIHGTPKRTSTSKYVSQDTFTAVVERINGWEQKKTLQKS